jgi:hypothetical protein
MGNRPFFASALACVALAGCAAAPQDPQTSPPVAVPAAVPAAPAAPEQPAQPTRSDPGLQRFRCDNGIAFTVRFGEGTAEIDAGSQGAELLLRDAGGITPAQTVYSSTQLKAEFGLGADGRQAMLHYASPPLEARCVRD